ncbi:DNA translocase FtsK [bacterium]|nr:DNA translocase FtsK [bacterium]
MKTLSTISLFLLGLGLVLAVVTYSPHDLGSGEWFLPAPRPIHNITGPFGAWIAFRLIKNLGYFSIFLGLLLILWSVGRFLVWKISLLAKISAIAFGWVISIALPVSVVGGEFREVLLGKSGTALSHLLAYTGSVGKIFVAFGIFIIWVLASTGIGFARPAKWMWNTIAALVGIAGKISEKRREKSRKERQRIIEQHRQRQEQIHRRISAARTGNIIPGQLPEELLSPPRKRTSPGNIEEETLETAPGLQDTEFVPPPIITEEPQSNIPAAEKSGETEEMLPPFDSAEASEEVFVSVSEGKTDEIVRAPQETDEDEAIEDELPPWLMKKIPASAPGIIDETQPSENTNPEEQTEEPSDTTKGSQSTEEIEVIEAPESPGVEIDAVDEEETSISEKIEELKKTKSNLQEDEEETIQLSEKPFSFPPVEEIFLKSYPKKFQYSEVELRGMAMKLFNALKTYKINGQIRAITPGPVITRYEFEPEPGTKLSRISQLADDLALALKARDVRIVAPIPGKGTVGIEVPNERVETVHISSILLSPAFEQTTASLPIALGKGVAGEPVVADLAKMPHLLIAGATGSGKSVCINSIITSLVCKRTPMEMRLLLIDPKRLELSIYNDIPFLIAPVVVENKEASAAFNWALVEMERRYKKLAEARVRKLVDYNKLVENKPELGKPLPHIVIIVDELADLMMTVANEIEEPIARLAQMARAVGIHLIIATQRPSVDVVTGIIKANFPSRIAFKVRSKIDSRTILDMGGAERLLGQGDMLYLPSGFADPIRIHGSYISTEETEALVEFLKQFPNPQQAKLSFKEQLAKKITQTEQDELFWEAAKIIVIAQKGSASHLQRKLRIGYTRAASIIDQLEAAGIVGPFEGSKPREVLIKTLEELDQLQRNMK